MLGQERDAPVAVDWLDCNQFAGYNNSYSHESEHDLGLMVSDFVENGSGGADSCWNSSDTDSAFSDFADNISLYKHSMDQYERDLLSVVHSLILSINETTHQPGKPEVCNASCIRFSLVKLLKSSGYDASINATKWQGFGKITGGEHEFINVMNHHDGTCSDLYIIDIDFRSHFEIARPIKAYKTLLNSLPPIYVGSTAKLKQFLQTMVKAAKYSLKQNSMPLPPWRSLAYLEAKWELTSEREIIAYEKSNNSTYKSDHHQCTGLLRRMKSCIEYEIEAKGLFIPIKNENNWRLKTKW
ncbi:hypothetical protein LguiB_000801 [Lonicera macranthoides]